VPILKPFADNSSASRQSRAVQFRTTIPCPATSSHVWLKHRRTT